MQEDYARAAPTMFELESLIAKGTFEVEEIFNNMKEIDTLFAVKPIGGWFESMKPYTSLLESLASLNNVTKPKPGSELTSAPGSPTKPTKRTRRDTNHYKHIYYKKKEESPATSIEEKTDPLHAHPRLVSSQDETKNILQILDGVQIHQKAFFDSTEYIFKSFLARLRAYVREYEEAKTNHYQARMDHNAALCRVQKERQRCKENLLAHIDLVKLLSLEKEYHQSVEKYRTNTTAFVGILQDQDFRVDISKMALKILDSEREYFTRMHQVIYTAATDDKIESLARLRVKRKNDLQIPESKEQKEETAKQALWILLIDLLVVKNGNLVGVLVELLPAIASESKANLILYSLAQSFIIQGKDIPNIIKKNELYTNRDAPPLEFCAFVISCEAKSLLKFMLFNFQPIATKLRVFADAEFHRFCSLVTCLSVWYLEGV